MFNVGGGEFLVILLVALIVLGPQKLPEAARQVASVARELRRISSGFQAEMRAALDDPMEEAARERGKRVVSSEESPAPDDDGEDLDHDDHPTDDEGEPISTAAAAGMYDAPSDLSNVPPPFTAVSSTTEDHTTEDHTTEAHTSEDHTSEDQEVHPDDGEDEAAGA